MARLNKVVAGVRIDRKQAAQILGVTTETVNRLVDQGKLSGEVKNSGRVDARDAKKDIKRRHMSFALADVTALAEKLAEEEREERRLKAEKAAEKKKAPKEAPAPAATLATFDAHKIEKAIELCYNRVVALDAAVMKNNELLSQILDALTNPHRM